MATTKCFQSLLDVSDFLYIFGDSTELSAVQLTLCILEQCTDVDSMNGLIGIFYRFATIWTCMDVMPTIVKALDDAHYAWKSRGVPSRPLLMLLMKFDNGRYLSESSRERLTTDISTFTLVTFSLFEIHGCSVACTRHSNPVFILLSLFLTLCLRLCS
jgi:hypothetical protein